MRRTFASGNRSYLIRVSIFLLVVALVTGMAGCDGNPSQNLEIRTWYDLDAVRNNLAGHHVLLNDLDSTTAGYEELAGPAANGGRGWEPLGTIMEWGYRLTGTFDGQGHEIRDLFINRPGDYYVALFGAVGQEGVVENTGVVDVAVTGGDSVGALVGFNEGAVSDSYSTGTVTSDGYDAGGLVGYNYGSVSDAYSSARVIGTHRVGGIVGVNEYGWVGAEGTVSNSYSTGAVTGEDYVGGLVGWNRNDATVADSYSSGRVIGNSGAGGLVGSSEGGTVRNSFWDIETSGQTTSTGGTGMNTTQMQDIVTFSEAAWDIIAVALNETNPSYIWNIVNNVTYPFLSWQAI
jgi:hypothetical protein